MQMNQGYDFSTDYVVAEDNSNVQIQSSAVVGLPAGLAVGNVYDNQQGKIIVPNDISHLQGSGITSFPSSIMVSDVVPVPTSKIDSDTKRKRPKVFQCTIDGCGKCFDSQWGLTRHIRVHTGEKPYKCTHPGCGKCFAEKCGLTRHMSTHDTSKPYKCTHPGCDKCFKSREYLESHRRLHEETDPFKCTINNCNRVFASIKSLRRHQVTWHNSKGTESPTEQQLREKILKLQQKYKERIEKMEKHLKDVMENNRQLKKENADYRREHMIPIGKVVKSKKGEFEQTDLSHIENKAVNETSTQPALSHVMTEKPDLSSGLFTTPIECPVEIDNFIGTPHVTSNGNLIVLPTMRNLPTIGHTTTSLQLEQDIDQPSNPDILL